MGSDAREDLTGSKGVSSDSVSVEGSSPVERAREQARVAREAEKSAERKRTMFVRGGVIVVVLILVGFIVGGAFLAKGNKASSSSSASPVSSQSAPVGPVALPKGVSDTSYAVSVSLNAKKGAPVVEVWEDFQCPFCALFSKSVMPSLVELAQGGDVDLLIRQASFLDQRFDNDASARAMSAWGCAIDQNYGNGYSTVVYQNQPAQEGAGFTNEQLVQFGKDVGISGAELDAFTKCVNDGKYLGWAVKSQEKFVSEGVQGTPTVIVNGNKLDLSQFKTPDEVIAGIRNAAGVSS